MEYAHMIEMEAPPKSNAPEYMEVEAFKPMATMHDRPDDEEAVISIPNIRLMNTNKGSRYSSAGDFIRGDPPIRPILRGYFDPVQAHHPATTLNRGAMWALGDDDTSKKLFDIIDEDAGGWTRGFGGDRVDRDPKIEIARGSIVSYDWV
jgi:hypothetical protein